MDELNNLQFESSNEYNKTFKPIDTSSSSQYNASNKKYVFTGKTYSQDILRNVMGECKCTVLEDTFFSEKNIQRIQYKLIKNVEEKSNHKIKPQNTKLLLNSMLNIYLLYSKNLRCNIPEQINTMNSILIDQLVPELINGMQCHEKYLNMINNMHDPLDNPTSTITDSKLPTWDFTL